MSILSELLPGARQIRTPLAIGYLWLLVLWLNVVRIPENVRDNSLFGRVGHDIGHMQPTLIVIIASFGAYLIGLIFEYIDQIAVSIAASLVWGGILTFLVLTALGLLTGYWPATLGASLITIVLFGIRAMRNGTSLVIETVQWAENRIVDMAEAKWKLKQGLDRFKSPSMKVAAAMVSEQAVNLIETDPALRAEFCGTLKLTSLRAACVQAGISSGTRASRKVSIDGTTVDIARTALRSRADAGQERILRKYLFGRMEASREVSKAVILRVMDTSDLFKIINRALDDAASRLQADKPGIFDVVDRLRNEGDLRRGIALPLALTFSSASWYYTSTVIFVLGAAAPAIFAYLSGQKKSEEAEKVVVSCINARIVEIEHDVSDVRLLKWQKVSIEGTASNVLSTRRWWPRVRKADVDAEPGHGHA